MDKTLQKIEEKVYSGVRISSGDALRLFASSDILALGKMADFMRKKNASDEVYYSYNLNINPTNVCELRCDLCAFSKDAGEAGSYELTFDEIMSKVKEMAGTDPEDLFEVHIVGGLNKKYGLDFYVKLLKAVKAIRKGISIQAFTAVEIEYLAEISKLEVSDVLQKLKNAGLDTMPGGGAEIFNKRVRDKICAKKISAKKWLEIMEKAHGLGISTNATMLYGHIETDAERVEHLEMLRTLQDRTGGFKCLVPLSFHQANTKIVRNRVNTGYDDLKVIAVGRIFLDNFPGVKALYTSLGLKFAQTALFFGANDLGGTSFDERIVKAAGANFVEGVTESDLIKIIKGAGRIAVRTDSTYTKKIIKEC